MILRTFAVVAFLVASAAPAFAYLDPGTGSFALQMLLAGALAVGAPVRVFWYRIKTFFRRLLGKSATPSEARAK